MKRAWVVAVAMVAACGTKAATAVPDAASASDTAGDVAKDAAVADGLAADASDAGGDALADAADAVDPAKSAYGLRCATLADKLCAAWQGCCDAGPTDCHAKMTELCLNPKKYQAIADAAVAGDMEVDPALDATCTATIAAAGGSCGEQALGYAMVSCLFAWIDKAKVGEECHAGREVACAGGKGLCVVTSPPDGYSCLTAYQDGNACSTTKPCLLGLSCDDTNLPRAKVCNVPGKKCQTGSDNFTCLPDHLCQADVCVPDPGAPKGSACQKASECHLTDDCIGGKCTPKLCVSKL
jgi:hypothetical protein